jgi:nicotinate phosphoribosyltransferase
MKDRDKLFSPNDGVSSPVVEVLNDGQETQVPLDENLRKELERPTISSLLDLDLYKLTMGQFAWRHFPNVPVTYEFTNRTSSVAVVEHVPQSILEAQLKRIQNLSVSEAEIAYLKTVKVGERRTFTDDYLDSLRDLHLPDVHVSREDGQYHISTKGPWAQAIYWETLILSTVNELYYRSILAESGKTETEVRNTGIEHLQAKIDKLKAYIAAEKNMGRTGPMFMDFGTRRRFAGDWQEKVVSEMAKAFPDNFTGTSNVNIASKLNIPARGTFAHEMDMVFSGIFYEEDDAAGAFTSHNKLLDMWYDEHGAPLSVALTDTYGSDFFFANFSPEQARKWNGIRQDSGDPIEFGERAIRFYKEHGIDPNTKTIVFSDGLDIDSIISIYEHFKGRLKSSFGWGTTLTNDVGFKTLSLVVKATEANGHKTTKLSDNLAKATGDPTTKERAVRLAGYTRNFFQECQV